MSIAVPLLIITSLSGCFSILFTVTNSVEATMDNSLAEQIHCNPSELTDCNQVQTTSNVTLSNGTSSISKQGLDSDQTSTSDSGKVEGQDEVQGGGKQGGKNVPGSPNIDEDKIAQVDITFKTIQFHKSYDPANKGYFKMYLYINGKIQPLIIIGSKGWPCHLTGQSGQYVCEIDTQAGKGIASWPPSSYGKYFLQSTDDQKKYNSFHSTLALDRPLSIMMGGYEADKCPVFNFPYDISNNVLAANGNKETLHKLQNSLTSNIKLGCGLGMLQLDNHDVLGIINEVYNPIPNYSGKCVDSTGTDGPDFTLCYNIYTSHTALNVDNIEK